MPDTLLVASLMAEQADVTRDVKPTCPRCNRGVLEPTEVTGYDGRIKTVLACDECHYVESID